jgi:hypothetical protein
MILAIFACISITFLGFSWFLYRRNIELFLCLLIMIFSEFFYLVPQIKGPEDYKVLLIPIVFILTFESLMRGKLAMGRYGWWVISFLVISVLGVIVASFSGQSILLGIKAAKFIPLVMIYFLLAGREINVDKFTNYFVIMALAVAAAATFQHFFHGGINLFPGLPKEGLSNLFERDLTNRVTVGHFIIPAAAIAAFARFNKSSNLLFLAAAIAMFVELLFVQQTRALLAATFLSMFVIYALSHRITPIRISAYIIFVGIFLTSLLFVSAADFENISLVKRTRTDIEKRKGSYQARINAYIYYWHQIEEKPIIGHGILNLNWVGNSEYMMRSRAVHLSDIGIIHLFVQAGLIGFFWLLYGLSRLWLDTIRFREKLPISSYFIVGTFAMATIDMFLRNDSIFLFAVILGLFSSTFATSETVAVKDCI